MNIDKEVQDNQHVTYEGEEREYTWSVNMELDKHAGDREMIVEEGKEAVRQTAPGYFVNFVTHGDHGHPSEYLYDELRNEFGDSVDIEYVDKCGCGGYVSRVHVNE
ncbi:MAG: CGCGG family rSAM-modified RiPP protein [Halobacteria archaeon]